MRGKFGTGGAKQRQQRGISCRYLSDWSSSWGDTAGDSEEKSRGPGRDPAAFLKGDRARLGGVPDNFTALPPLPPHTPVGRDVQTNSATQWIFHPLSTIYCASHRRPLRYTVSYKSPNCYRFSETKAIETDRYSVRVFSPPNRSPSGLLDIHSATSPEKI